jgi:hypothetical protein
MNNHAAAILACDFIVAVTGHVPGAAAFAAQDVSTQRRAATLFDGRHDLELRQAQVRTLRTTPGGAVLAEDVGDLQGNKFPPL